MVHRPRWARIRHIRSMQERSAELAYEVEQAEQARREAAVQACADAIDRTLDAEVPMTAADAAARHVHALRMEMQRRTAAHHARSQTETVAARQRDLMGARRQTAVAEAVEESKEAEARVERERPVRRADDDRGLDQWWRRNPS